MAVGSGSSDGLAYTVANDQTLLADGRGNVIGGNPIVLPLLTKPTI